MPANNKRLIFGIVFSMLLPILTILLVLQSYNINKLSAGGINSTNFFLNAPITIVNGQVDKYNGQITKSAGLFTSSGVNLDTLLDLMNKINDKSVLTKGIPVQNGELIFYTAEDFGKYEDLYYGSLTENQKGNAQILVDLFGNSSYWQVVYRSMNNEHDVLTLYSTFGLGGNMPNTNVYHDSSLRQVMLDTYNSWCTTYPTLDQYVIAPYQLSSYGASDLSATTLTAEQNQPDKFYNLGAWQSSAVQTGNSISGLSQGLGSSPHIQNANDFSCINGLDGLNVASFIGENASCYTDKLWTPSAFEVMYTGYGEDTNVVKFDNGNTPTYFENSVSVANTDVIVDIPTNTSSRTGLWKLNAYDRATNNFVWLRSIPYGSTSQFRVIHRHGAPHQYIVQDASYWRPAIHIDLTELTKLITHSVTANASSGENTSINPSELGGITQNDVNRMQEIVQNEYVGKVYQEDTSVRGQKTIYYSYNPKMYDIVSFSINGQTILMEDAFGSGTSTDGLCEYSYNKNMTGLAITISNVKGDINIEAQAERYNNFDLVISMTNNSNRDLLLAVSSTDTGAIYRISSSKGQISLTLPTLVVQREYKFTLIGQVKIQNTINLSANYTITMIDDKTFILVCSVPNEIITLDNIVIVENNI